MSVAEIKEQLKRLSAAELDEVEKLVAELKQNGTARVREIHPDDPGVSERIDAVLKKHDKLLRRLAQ